MKTVSMNETGIETAAAQAAEMLRAGGIVLYPTDTLYGLAVDAQDPEAVARLVALKGRSAEKAISIVVKDAPMLETYALVSETARALIGQHLPGALTLVLPARGAKLEHLAPDGTIGVRIPDDSFTNALSRAFDAPYTATSANLSGQPARGTVEEILRQFGDRAQEISLAVDDGPREGSAPSTVVRVAGGRAELLREGAIAREALGLQA